MQQFDRQENELLQQQQQQREAELAAAGNGGTEGAEEEVEEVIEDNEVLQGAGDEGWSGNAARSLDSRAPSGLLRKSWTFPLNTCTCILFRSFCLYCYEY